MTAVYSRRFGRTTVDALKMVKGYEKIRYVTHTHTHSLLNCGAGHFCWKFGLNCGCVDAGRGCVE